MIDDLVKRIREWDEGCGEWELLEASADRIEKLEAALRNVISVTIDSVALAIAVEALEGKDD